MIEHEYGHIDNKFVISDKILRVQQVKKEFKTHLHLVQRLTAQSF